MATAIRTLTPASDPFLFALSDAYIERLTSLATDAGAEPEVTQSIAARLRETIQQIAVVAVLSERALIDPPSRDVGSLLHISTVLSRLRD